MPNKQLIPPPSFDQFFHALPGLYLLMTPEFLIVDVTNDYAQAALTPRENIVGQYFFTVFPNNPDLPDFKPAEELKQSLQYVLEHKAPHTIPVLRYDIRDHTDTDATFVKRYWTACNSPILDADNNVSYILHEICDVTEQEALKKEKLGNHEHLSILANAVHAVNWEYDLLTDSIHWGYGLAQVLGYTPEEMGNGIEGWTLRIHPDDLRAVLDSLEQARTKGLRNWSAEYRFRKASGDYAYFLDTGYILYDEQNRPFCIKGSLIDLSASKQAELALKESNARFQHLIEALPYMAWTADANGKVLFYNKIWYKYTGMPEGQTEGWLNYVHPEDSAHVITTWSAALQSGYYQVECRIRRQSDNSYRWFLGQAVSIRDENGKIQFWVGTTIDINEQMQALEHLVAREF
ncbi:PAS domain-containing protein [Pontibacter ruber]|uniref:histidine kinase n=1 Tax=Pontibacter ruber TaxID=1343895 RepID=A0ABW5CWM0_9BACT|nr:PAS domain-containing protein [Pontibacter ruber]